MLIVLPGALPASPPIAGELAKRLPTAAPTLHAWLRAADARAAGFDPHDAGCTPYEAWQLERAGFQPAPDQQIGAGLGPLLARATAGAPRDSLDPVWIADLAHVALSTENANLLPMEALTLSAEEGAALYETARPLFEGTGFDAHPLEPGRWRVRLPADLHPRTASPAAVGGQSLAGWWNQDAAVRPWRRLMNEIQMVWHDHPVNEDRAGRGLPPVNTLWLYGGAAPWRALSAASTSASAANSPASLRIVEDLLPAFAAEDWGAWLNALQQMDARVFKPLSDRRGLPAQPVELLLLGRDRRVDLTLKPRSPLLGWLPSSAKNWSAWWSPRA
ncbi:hypothetical protein CAL29_11475 [Bordetella genomosp. 10]|uniref:Phosphoglycerate mutase n=1 Tax=Bordetella genomosp. 10 TaxID=1416804 RepID=A0A261SB32_9BORD|nr:hypothetical protein [Bordetella genomosp. 10]OZI34162.1 hypothetical protein CAL29_11475 [Bordetella genomosp. 10]